MEDERIETAKKLAVKAMVEHVMQKDNISYESAIEKLQSTELYNCLNEPGILLYLEDHAYLCHAYDREVEKGRDAMYWFIQNYCSWRPWEWYLVDEDEDVWYHAEKKERGNYEK